ncbi:MAG TPA: hypothetical protein VKX45_19975 [Bryobacteraceae bacterium]|jgi:hypothetical protein|nr:hypothetical protein [Bryobacteraceae bacterium]
MADTPLTYEEHRDLSRELQTTCDRLVQLSELVRQVYGAESRPAAAFGRAWRAMEVLRAALGEQAAADCPGRQAEKLYE